MLISGFYPQRFKLDLITACPVHASHVQPRLRTSVQRKLEECVRSWLDTQSSKGKETAC